eukprot:4918964-Alexandrium_andersonii.AAC.1
MLQHTVCSSRDNLPPCHNRNVCTCAMQRAPPKAAPIPLVPIRCGVAIPAERPQPQCLLR